MSQDRQVYLLHFLRGCATAADEDNLGVEVGRLMLNGQLMNEAADEFSRMKTALEPKEFKNKTEKFRHHLARAHFHAQRAYELMFESDGPKRSYMMRSSIGKAQNILITWYVRETKRQRKESEG